MKKSGFRLAASAALLLGLTLPGLALTPSCQAELDKHGGERLKVIQRINNFKKTRTTPQQACNTFNDLVRAEAAMLKWMEENQTYCQLPEPFVEDFKKGTEQGTKFRQQICNAAKKQARQPAAPRGPTIGGGVQLPKGAL